MRVASVSNEREQDGNDARLEKIAARKPIASRARMETTRAAAHLYRRVTRVVFESALHGRWIRARNVDAHTLSLDEAGKDALVR